jgi:hypothetical protein
VDAAMVALNVVTERCLRHVDVNQKEIVMSYQSFFFFPAILPWIAMIYMIKKDVNHRSDIFVIIYVIAIISFFSGGWFESAKEGEKQKIFCHMSSKYVMVCDFSDYNQIMDNN